MLVVALIAPLFFMGLIIVLGLLEEYVVAPTDRAAAISRLMERASPDVIEREVATLLAPVTTRVRKTA